MEEDNNNISSTQNDNCDDLDSSFLDVMVKKCEVSSYRELFIKLIREKGNLIRCDTLFSNDPKFSIEKIKSEIVPIEEILSLKLFDPHFKAQTLESRKNKIHNDFSKIFYLVNEEGLRYIIKNYLKEHFFTKDMNIKQMIDIFEIDSNETEKFKKMIHNLIDNKKIFAEISNLNDETNIIHFQSILEIKEKRKKLIQLILTIGVFILLLIWLLQYSGLMQNY
jgi:hypothetical protein